MLSIKNIDFLNININNKDVNYNSELLIIKTPIVNGINSSEDEENLIKIQLDFSLKSSNRLKETLLYIKRLYSKINLDFDIKESIDIIIDSDSLFFDSNHNRITKNSINKESRIICSFFIKEAKLYLHQCMKI